MHKNPIVRQIRVIPTTDSITINNLSNILSLVIFRLKFFYCLMLTVFDWNKSIMTLQNQRWIRLLCDECVLYA